MIGHHVILVYNWERVQRIAIIKLFLFPPYFCEHIFSACISTRKENRNRTEAKHCLILKINNTYLWIEEQTKKKAFPCQWRDTFTITMYFCYLLKFVLHLWYFDQLYNKIILMHNLEKFFLTFRGYSHRRFFNVNFNIYTHFNFFYTHIFIAESMISIKRY